MSFDWFWLLKNLELRYFLKNYKYNNKNYKNDRYQLFVINYLLNINYIKY